MDQNLKNNNKKEKKLLLDNTALQDIRSLNHRMLLLLLTKKMNDEDESVSKKAREELEQFKKVLPNQQITLLVENINNILLELNNARQLYLRTLADSENFRKSLLLEQSETQKYKSFTLAKALLPVLDNFEKAWSVNVEHPELENFLIGFELIYKSLQQIFVQNNIEVIPTKEGDIFNQDLHHAVEKKESDKFKNHEIIKILQKGYKLHDRVIRPTMVIVAKNKSQKN